MNLGLHIIQTPSGRYTFAGAVPAALCDVVPADRAAVMGGRAWESVDGGELLTTRVRAYPTRGEAQQAALLAGFDVHG